MGFLGYWHLEMEFKEKPIEKLTINTFYSMCSYFQGTKGSRGYPGFPVGEPLIIGHPQFEAFIQPNTN